MLPSPTRVSSNAAHLAEQQNSASAQGTHSVSIALSAR
jgi:hypothetical protein